MTYGPIDRSRAPGRRRA